MSAGNNERTLTAKTTATNRNRLKSISYYPQVNKRTASRKKSPLQVSRFFGSVSLWLNKEMNPAVGPGPDDLVFPESRIKTGDSPPRDSPHYPLQSPKNPRFPLTYTAILLPYMILFFC